MELLKVCASLITIVIFLCTKLTTSLHNEFNYADDIIIIFNILLVTKSFFTSGFFNLIDVMYVVS
jgi:hypothetical protein